MRLKRASYLTTRTGLLVTAGLCVLIGVGCRGVVSSGTGEDQGKLGIWLTDPGISEYDRLELTITSVDIKHQDQADPIRVELDRPLVVDLTRIAQRTSDRREKLFDNEALPLGRYEWIQLNLDETRLFIEDQGAQYPLVIPPGEEEGLRLTFNAAVDDRTNLDLTIDFNADKALRNLGNNNFELRPAPRLLRTERTGTLTGRVAESLVRDRNCNNGSNHDEGNRVYVFSGTVNFQDLQGNQNDPLLTAPVTPRTSDNDYEFSVGFLPHGRYTAVFTCDRSIDDPGMDNLVDMITSEMVELSIDAGQTTSISFESSF